jgi:hypothetical protein
MAGPITQLTTAPIIGITEPSTFTLPPGPPSFDPIETLPPAAADKLRALRQHAADAPAVVPVFEDVRLASADRVAAEQRLRSGASHRTAAAHGRNKTRALRLMPTADVKSGTS